MDFTALLNAIKAGTRQISLSGLWGSSKALLVALIYRETKRPCLIITPGLQTAIDFQDDLAFFLRQIGSEADKVTLFPQWELSPYELLSPHRETVAERFSALDKLLSREKVLTVAPVETMMQKVLPRCVLYQVTQYIEVGAEINREQLVEQLIYAGYRSVEIVEARGEFSVRGGILDVYPPVGENPLRIEFFGDAIESIREFDVTSQRSVGQMEIVTLLPIREIVLDQEAIQRGIDSIKARIAEIGASYNTLNTLMNQLEQATFFPGMERYASYFYPDLETLFDYLDPQSLLFVDEVLDVTQVAAKFERKVREGYEHALDKGHPVSEPDSLYLTDKQIMDYLGKWQRVELGLVDFGGSGSVRYDLGFKPLEWGYVTTSSEDEKEQHLAFSTKRLAEWMKAGNRVLVVSRSRVQAERLGELLAGYQLKPIPREEPILANFLEPDYLIPKSENLFTTIGDLTTGFYFPDFKLFLVSEEELLGRRGKVRYRRKVQRPSRLLTTLGELEINDFVVHIDHGIGKYLGLKKLKLQNMEIECLHLEYRDGDKLYVPIDRLDLVQKYKGADENPPQLDKLGGTSWARVKERVKASIQKMANELLELYALRQALPGFSFSSEDRLYKEFEASFEYEETPDQNRAIREMLQDMAIAKPMDRLICGDVGYGKTEVAMRAAFMTVLNGKQVAVLVPTTLLAQQHLYTFQNRFAPYPVRVESLSRFKTRREQQAVVKGLKEGSVDIVIGTHRLIQKDVEFKDLGLVIIDEEHRFGVAHKEKLRQLRKLVDVLTLTATPIPRTLHMSLMSVRDMSIIDTPPEERLSVYTYVVQFDEGLIQEAILREMDRGGQIFFVHNRVKSIEAMANYLRRIAPTARIVIAHGQMEESTLEKIMQKFVAREYDILVCTTIIESGLDIPAANTIFINRADKFGLAQLYQLRGRVGRSRHRAYAYLLIPNDRRINMVAKKRLRVIQELSELGSGFKVSAHDLEIRGAGNLLGAEQSGHIAALGFDLYCQMIARTVKELKGEAIEEELHPQINLEVSAYFPEKYVPDMKQRLEIYKKLSSAQGFGKILDVEDEIRDRYGALPEEVKNLVTLAELRLISKELRIESIRSDKELVTVCWDKLSPVNPEHFVKVTKAMKGRVKVLSSRSLELNLAGIKKEERIGFLKNFLLAFR
jgi:transcription-repair coupling factor (superfamily II helicase)